MWSASSFEVSVEFGEADDVVGDEVLEFSYDFTNVSAAIQVFHPYVVSSFLNDCFE